MGICSRREADRLISEGKIKVNGEPASLGMEISGEEEIEIAGERISGQGERREKPKAVLLAYYKPRGVICTTGEKDRGKNVIEDMQYPERIYPIGRLDKDSEGLLLLTNQGDLVNAINRSRFEKEKEYIVTVDKDIRKGCFFLNWNGRRSLARFFRKRRFLLPRERGSSISCSRKA